jgi:HEAT repeat protein
MTESSWAAIVEKLKSKDKASRYGAILQLGNRNDKPEAYGLLIQQMNQPDLDYKHAAINSLGRLKDKRATKLLVDELLNNENLEVQCWVAEALWHIEDVSALDALLVAAKRNHNSLRWYIAKALANMPDPRAFDVLSEYIKDEEDTGLRRASMFSLAKQAKHLDFNIEDLLVDMSKNDSNEDIRMLAAIILEKWDTDLLD